MSSKRVPDVPFDTEAAPPRRLDTHVLGRRLIAHVIDTVLALAAALAPSATAAILIGGAAGGALCLAVFAAAYVTYMVWLPGRTGWTPGKRLLGLRVGDEHGRPVGFLRSLKRFAPLLLEQTGLVALRAMLRSDRHQRWGDRWAGTYVGRLH